MSLTTDKRLTECWGLADPDEVGSSEVDEDCDDMKERAEVETRVLEWASGSTDYLPWCVHMVPVRLRIKDDLVETSLGANFPVAHARRGIRFIESVIDSGREYVRGSGPTLRLGHYTVDGISTDGTVVAGCHVVQYPEVRKIADAIKAMKGDGKDEAVDLVMA